MKNPNAERPLPLHPTGAIAPAPSNYYATLPRAAVLIGLRASSPQLRIDAALDHLIGDFARMLGRSRGNPLASLADHIAKNGGRAPQ